MISRDKLVDDAYDGILQAQDSVADGISGMIMLCACYECVNSWMDLRRRQMSHDVFVDLHRQVFSSTVGDLKIVINISITSRRTQ